MTPVIMGVVNATPDSFSDGGRFLDPDAALRQADALLAAGATIIDVGGESTRPGAERVGADEEMRRALPVVTALARRGVRVSIDTMNAATARAAVHAGAAIVNDVSGGLADPQLLGEVAASSAQVVLGHWRGPSSDMYARADYADPVQEVADELAARIAAADVAGIPRDRVIVDPGIGFGKTPAQSWAVLAGLERLVAAGARVLVGTSRKRFLQTALDTHTDAAGATADEARRDLATAVTSVLAAQAGAWGVRVHNAGATRDALAVLAHWQGRTS
ncbi:dihydropteroate synthase [Microbacterium sp. LRZ72]|uniref:dihydropteroate synthase n=1 Tax=Microbacterium sp. LRZ72 TaxID=2942481 RepID=UPI0029A7D1F2|nr:dihydropteroate synthase [Microbacterium sp. LRZ72]MDX2377835.1 dihydropteroate synthase [Microbacterium sp. LRZ72]